MKIRKILVSSAILFFTFLCGAKTATYSGLFNGYNQSATCLTELSEFSYYQCPSSLSIIDSNIINSNLSVSKFGLPELNSLSLTLAKKFSECYSGGMFFAGEGNNLFSEFSAGLAASYRLTDFFSAGISSGLSRRTIKDYGTDYRFNINLGILVRFNEYINAAIEMQNISAGVNPSGNSAARMFVAGIASNPVRFLFLDLSLVTDLKFTTGVTFGIKYTIGELISIRLGLLTNPSTFNLGLGLSVLKNLRLNAETFYNLNLGLDNRMGFSYFF